MRGERLNVIWDEAAFKAAQKPHHLPQVPRPICAICKREAMVRVVYDAQWTEYVIAVGCHGAVQSARIGMSDEDGASIALVWALIGNLKEVFKPQ